MTSADIANASVCILIDGPDGYIEEFAWVKVTTITPTPDAALAKLELEFPIDEQGFGGEALHYTFSRRTWHKPDGETEEGHARWTACAEGEGEEFFQFEVTDEQGGPVDG